VELFVFYLVDGFTLAWVVFGKLRQEIVPIGFAQLSSGHRILLQKRSCGLTCRGTATATQF